MQYKSIHSGIPQVYSKCYHIKLYILVKTGCKLAGSCKIISLCKMYVGKFKILSYKIKLLKWNLNT
jgi:hypothetical protein